MALDLIALASTASAACSPSEDQVVEAVEAARGEVEAVLGCPWVPTSVVETFEGTGQRMIQISGLCIAAITRIECVSIAALAKDPEAGWRDITLYVQDNGSGGLVHPSACGGWGPGLRVRVTYIHGLSGAQSDTAGRLLVDAASRGISECSKGVKSETMGSYSRAFFDRDQGSMGSITEAETRLLRKLVDQVPSTGDITAEPAGGGHPAHYSAFGKLLE